MDNLNGKKYYTIGEVSNLIQIPSSALRYYDEQGLLSPELRSSDTGYRYYSETQVMRAMMISEMRRIDLPISDIKKQLESRELISQRENISKLYAKLKDELAHIMFKDSYIRTLIDSLDRGQNYISTSKLYENRHCPVIVRYLPGTDVIKIPVKGNFYEQERFSSSQRRLYDIADTFNLQITGTAISRFCNPGREHFSMHSYDSEWLLPVAGKNEKCDQMEYLNGQWVICSAHVGSYDSIYKTYETVLLFAADQGIEICGSPLENYVISCAHTCGAENYVTEVMFPITK